MKNLAKWTGIGFIVLLVNTGYIAAFASPTIFYMSNVLLHLALGLALVIALLVLLKSDPEIRRGIAVPAGLFLISAGLAVYLAFWGNTAPHHWAFLAHIGTAGLGLAALIPYIWNQTASHAGRWRGFQKAFIAAMAFLVILPAGAAAYRKAFPAVADHIRNPLEPPESMEQEGAGPKSPFFPASANTNTGKIIPSNFFMDSQVCGECHKDIYQQWNSSSHHFASFNNQFYRTAILYMQDTVGTQPSKWCAGCHDHAVFFNGRFDRPMKEQIDTPEAHAGLACTSCHAIVQVDSSMGNNGFTIQYPPLNQLLVSKNRFIRASVDFMTYLDPVPHKKTFMKPFMQEQSAQFCSACHKVHLDVPVNGYRWFRGFDDYDNWQASGVSGQSARSFYYPAKSAVCVDCHMPLTPSKDPGNVGGYVHSHRFPGANTALPYVNQDDTQLKTEEAFLKSGFITVDIFAASPEESKSSGVQMVRRASPENFQAMSSSGVGEEVEQNAPAIIREVGKVAAPVDKAGVRFQRGSTNRIDVVVRTRKIGHIFPGGTVDAFDIWVELQGKDADGKVIYWSGKVADDGKGPVDPGAHFYRSYQLDGDGNMINKRNAWQARSVLYVRQIPPGAADVVHYRIQIPKDAKGPITLTAKLNYRKFSYYYTQFSYAGKPKPNQAASLVGPDHNDLEYSFNKSDIPENVSGEIKGEIPNLPIVTMAQAEAKLELGDDKAEPDWKPVIDKADRERWNDWGIGLLAQGDLKGAEYAFKRTTEAEPGYADGWLNVARALIQEGETDAAKPYIEKALAVNPKLGGTYYFKALIQKADGDYDGALQSLRAAESMYPTDRVVLNQIARILFLKRQYKDALRELDRVALVDPEDLQMHYTRMLCLRGLQDADGVAREQKLFLRFKADESSQAVTAKARMLSPEDNNERQQVHEHDSVNLEARRPADVAKAAATSKRTGQIPAAGTATGSKERKVKNEQGGKPDATPVAALRIQQ